MFSASYPPEREAPFMEEELARDDRSHVVGAAGARSVSPGHDRERVEIFELGAAILGCDEGVHVLRGEEDDEAPGSAWARGPKLKECAEPVCGELAGLAGPDTGCGCGCGCCDCGD